MGINPDYLNADTRANLMRVHAARVRNGHNAELEEALRKLFPYPVYFARPDTLYAVFTDLLEGGQHALAKLFLETTAKVKFEESAGFFFHLACEKQIPVSFFRDMHDLLAEDKRARFLERAMVKMAEKNRIDMIDYCYSAAGFADMSARAVDAAYACLREDSIDAMIDLFLDKGVLVHQVFFRGAQEIAFNTAMLEMHAPENIPADPFASLRHFYNKLRDDTRYPISVDDARIHKATALQATAILQPQSNPPTRTQTAINRFYDALIHDIEISAADKAFNARMAQLKKYPKPPRL